MQAEEVATRGRRGVDFTGRIFGQVTVLEILPNAHRTNGTRDWLCMCGCGIKFQVNATRLNAGVLKHCGCKSKKRREPYIAPSPPLRTPQAALGYLSNMLEYNGVAKSFLAWGKEFGIEPQRLFDRYTRLGWSAGRSLELEQ